jgi:ferric-dicitrate binding protein FerR (iron transport regulator)
MKYSDYSAGDFIKDEYFQTWVFNQGDESVIVFWESFLANHPEMLETIEEARHALKGIQFSNYALTETELTNLWNRIHDLETSGSGENSTKPRNQWHSAAVAAVLITLMSVVYFWGEKKAWKEYQTAYGETRTVVLPDGSSVVLNANSTLTLFSDWNEEPEREIWLDGEAFFSVVHKKDNKLFRVKTKEGVSVEVLGTTFNVYNRINGTKVVLNSGQIRLSLPTTESPERIVMKPGEMVEYKEQHFKKKEVDPEMYTAWTDNKIILNKTKLSEMVNMLKDTYGLDVRVSDSVLLDQTVSGSMPLGNAEVLLQQMAKAFQLHIRKENNTIIMEELYPELK